VKVLLFGGTGMIGQGALRECLRDPGVEEVVSIVRRPTGAAHAKLREIVHGDFFDFSPIERELAGFDACFFCLGVSSAGMKEPEYRRLTYDLTLAAARALAPANPAMTFIYVSGMGTDSSGHGRLMWARVKGETENALRGLPFKAACMFRPALVQPMHAVRSKTALYRAVYTLTRPLLPLLRSWFPSYVTTTEEVGLAMLSVARHGAASPILENRDINERARETAGP
jgi:uncharacterized protein YbjT (DUF2867 family)